MKVLIAGAGLGGLTLAHALRNRGIDVSVHERDASPWERPQGYRLHLDADAVNAARDVLSPELRAEFEATCHHTTPFTTILGTDLAVRTRIPTGTEHDPAVWPGATEPGHANVDRATLRRILLTGIDVRYGNALASYESDSEGVTAHFADGSTERGDVLVGADGIRSAVRRQRLPGHDTVDAGITAIYGRLPAGADGVPPEVASDIFAIASDERKVFLGLGSVRTPETSYDVCIVGGRHEYFPALQGADLQRVAADMLAGWSPAAARVVMAGDPASFFPVEMYTSVPRPLDAPTNVTLLGDAVHAMTPTLGRGANVAMRDGVLLARALTRAPIPEALAAYEQEMTTYGFGVVRAAAAIGEQRMSQNPLPSSA
jgi:2-polyprenyl-6-methoxyphenol hydroxylase-like FAD-dependent oxidoreductase